MKTFNTNPKELRQTKHDMQALVTMAKQIGGISPDDLKQSVFSYFNSLKLKVNQVIVFPDLTTFIDVNLLGRQCKFQVSP